MFLSLCLVHEQPISIASSSAKALWRRTERVAEWKHAGVSLMLLMPRYAVEAASPRGAQGHVKCVYYEIHLCCDFEWIILSFTTQYGKVRFFSSRADGSNSMLGEMTTRKEPPEGEGTQQRRRRKASPKLQQTLEKGFNSCAIYEPNLNLIIVKFDKKRARVEGKVPINFPLGFLLSNMKCIVKLRNLLFSSKVPHSNLKSSRPDG